jgi:hypothetical protein
MGKTGFLPTVPMIIPEVVRQSAVKKQDSSKCRNWPKPKLLEWLSSNPIENLEDVNFLIKEEDSFCKIIADTKKEKVNVWTTNEPTKKKLPWNSNGPFLLHLYHCFLDAFQKKDDALNHQQLDANKSTKHPPTYAELARDMFINPKFRPIL